MSGVRDDQKARIRGDLPEMLLEGIGEASGAAEEQKRDRHAIDGNSADLFRRGLYGAAEGEARGKAASLRIAADIFIEVVGCDGVDILDGLRKMPAQIEALAPRDQRLGKKRHPMKALVPKTLLDRRPGGNVEPEKRQGRVEQTRSG
ncbi:hypothetical protein [Paraburkholderia sp. Ac-20342]|uniref:hypothetical protein n=1 Tax=Paraburkholderia sp. Ac-20342 TaxID=2703889 RepID=UPI001F11B653|nr:hypothetical protein [Paraburkholderia sp. Ac-20342]